MLTRTLIHRCNPFTGEVLQFLPVITPKNALSVNADWDVGSVGSATLSLHADGTYSSHYFVDPFDATPNPGYTIYNGRISLRDLQIGTGKIKGTFSFWAKNITNKEYQAFDFPLNYSSSLSGGNLVYFNDPRTYGVDLKMKF